MSVCVREYIMYPVHCTGVSFGLLFFFIQEEKNALHLFNVASASASATAASFYVYMHIKIEIKKYTDLLNFPPLVYFLRIFFHSVLGLSLSLWFFFFKHRLHIFSICLMGARFEYTLHTYPQLKKIRTVRQ